MRRLLKEAEVLTQTAVKQKRQCIHDDVDLLPLHLLPLHHLPTARRRLLLKGAGWRPGTFTEVVNEATLLFWMLKTSA